MPSYLKDMYRQAVTIDNVQSGEQAAFVLDANNSDYTKIGSSDYATAPVAGQAALERPLRATNNRETLEINIPAFGRHQAATYAGYIVADTKEVDPTHGNYVIFPLLPNVKGGQHLTFYLEYNNAWTHCRSLFVTNKTRSRPNTPVGVLPAPDDILAQWVVNKE